MKKKKKVRGGDFLFVFVTYVMGISNTHVHHVMFHVIL